MLIIKYSICVFLFFEFNSLIGTDTIPLMFFLKKRFVVYMSVFACIRNKFTLNPLKNHTLTMQIMEMHTISTVWFAIKIKCVNKYVEREKRVFRINFDIYWNWCCWMTQIVCLQANLRQHRKFHAPSKKRETEWEKVNQKYHKYGWERTFIENVRSEFQSMMTKLDN